ncbi:MAG: CHAD domain-containing protein [Anaerolineales bacterium]|nr:CHAD domain-containing protein [Anaerolineales bacterium]
MIPRPDLHGPPASIPAAPAITSDLPFDQAVRAILIFYLEKVQSIPAGPKAFCAPDEISDLLLTIRAARHVFRAMGEQFDVTDVASIPQHLRWMSKSTRPLWRLHSLTLQAEDHLASAEGDTAGLEEMLHDWTIRRSSARAELLAALGSRRYQDFVKAALKFARTENAGIFGKTAARRQLRFIIPSLIWEQYQQLRLLEDDLESPKGRLLRDMRRQARSLYHFLAHFRATLGPAATNCLDSLQALDTHLTHLNLAGLAKQRSREYLAAGEGTESPVEGIEQFIAAKRKEREELKVRLPYFWAPLVSLRFRRDLGQAVAEL